MRIDVTVQAADGSRHDLAVLADDTALTHEVMSRLAEEVRIDRMQQLTIDDRPVEPESAWHTQLRTGSVVSHSAEPRPPAATARVVVASGAQAGETRAVAGRTVLIGRGRHCDLVLHDPDVSREHARLIFDATGTHVEDLASTNGTSVDGEALRAGRTVVDEHCMIRLGNTALRVELGTPSAPASEIRHAVAWPELPARSRPGLSLVSSLAASVGGAAAMGAVTRSTQVLLLGLCAPLILGGISSLEWIRRTRRTRRDDHEYRVALASAQAELNRRGRAQAACRRWSSPDAVELARRLESGTPVQDPGATLPVRIGLCDQVVDVPIATLRDTSKPSVAPLAPLMCDLGDGVLRIGGDREAALRLARWIVAQACAALSADRLAVTLVVDPERDADWAWARWLPHLDASSPKRALREVKTSGAASGARHVVMVDCAEAVAYGRDAMGSAAGIVIVLMPTGSTPECGPRVHVSGRGTLEHQSADGATSIAVCDGIDADVAERLARLLAARPSDRADGSCPGTSVLALAGSPDAETIASRWATNDGAATVVIGVENGRPFSIDLCADGPHALVVGTTGSGKSELLQTIVAGLALRYPPDELSFALIDYKGGATFGRLQDLPHVASVVTDLDHGVASRALLSLQAELRRREALFACAGVASLSGYRVSQHAPVVPRLVIVVDEFAALVSDQPDLLDGLVSVAQRGRSLGVHLVLATQRSGGAIAQDIRTNASLRIALRMEDVAESRDLIGSGDAALISSDRPGDAIARTTSGLHEVHIASLSGAAPAHTTTRVVPLGPWRKYAGEHIKPCTTELDRAVAMTCEAASTAGRDGHPAPWCPPLPSALPLTDIDDRCEPRAVPIGLADLPERQAQTVLAVDLDEGESCLFVGSPRSGRTTALVTLVRSAAARLSPSELAIYAVDASGGGLISATKRHIHLASAASTNDAAHVARLVYRLHLELKQRQTKAVHVSQTDEQARGAVLLLVDGFDRLLTTLDAFDGGATSIALSDLVTQGPSCGISVAATADIATATRSGAAFAAVLAMGAHATAALCRRVSTHTSDASPPGRGTRVSDGAAIQIAIAEETNAGADWADAKVACDRIIVRPLPESATLDQIEAPSDGFVLGVGGDEAVPICVDLVRHRARLLVSGPPASGKSTTLISLLDQAMSMGLPVAVATGTSSPLAAAAATFGLSAVSPDETHPPISCEAGLLLIDDVDQFVDTRAEDALLAIIRSTRQACAVVASGDATNLSLLQRGAAAELRRSRAGLALQPRQIDGDLFGVRLSRAMPTSIPGRGLLMPDPTWISTREPISIQVAVPATYPYPMCG